MESLAIRKKTALRLLREEDWDIFFLCVTETDRLHHFFLDRRCEPDFVAFYQRLDELICELYGTTRKEFGDDFLFLILSDHGFVPLKKEVNLNVCLQETGILTLDNNKEYYQGIAPGTIAFAMDPGRIYVHYEDKFPNGHIKTREKRSVRKALKTLFSNLKDGDGSKPIRKIYEKEEIYDGPYTDAAPDLLLMANDGFGLKGNLRKHKVFSNDIFTGMHSWHNAILVAPEYVKVADHIDIKYPSKLIMDYFS
jgi:predicted AlkP superfamily phosphohydrolase/phosphomutase